MLTLMPFACRSRPTLRSMRSSPMGAVGGVRRVVGPYPNAFFRPGTVSGMDAVVD